jgi:phosphate:Na+ symporter
LTAAARSVIVAAVTQQLITFAGGVGLFLLGMRLMSDGLKVAAGPALHDLLAAATRSRLRGLASGALITALVQSSSAVLFATIGFVNAGLLSLGQSVGVIFGANVGTTLTSWIVAVVGFNVDLQALAMPAVALGMAAWVLGRGRRAAFGQAVVGFGIFFLGLDVLKDAFAGVGSGLDLGQWIGDGVGGLLLATAVGIGLTVLMQSSSAALAVTLTAAAGGVVPLSAAAAMVIGANVGTTSTAVLASIGATAAAQRAAAAHVVFNLVAAVAALLLLPLLLWGAEALLGAAAAEQQPATVLALFHTATKVLGVLLMWPLTAQLVVLLERHIGGRQRDPAEPRFLDRTVLATPRLALDALRQELLRITAMAQQMARGALSSEGGDDRRLHAEQASLQQLGEAVIGFAAAVNSGGDALVDQGLPRAVRVVQYCRAIAERSLDLARLAPAGALPAELSAQLAELHRAADRALGAADPEQPLLVSAIDAAGAEFQAVYQQSKGDLLRAGSRGQLSPAALVRSLDRASALRRIVDQADKAARLLAQLTEPAVAVEPA